LHYDLREALATVESAIGDPRQGLPEDVFLLVSRITPLINIDLLIHGPRVHSSRPGGMMNSLRMGCQEIGAVQTLDHIKPGFRRDAP
jgi:hypothetical protein